MVNTVLDDQTQQTRTVSQVSNSLKLAAVTASSKRTISERASFLSKNDKYFGDVVAAGSDDTTEIAANETAAATNALAQLREEEAMQATLNETERLHADLATTKKRLEDEAQLKLYQTAVQCIVQQIGASSDPDLSRTELFAFIGDIFHVDSKQHHECVENERQKALVDNVSNMSLRTDLLVKIIAARNLSIQDTATRSSDPFVSVFLTNVSVKVDPFRTQVKKKNLNPVWNEQVTLNVENTHRQTLVLELYDWDLNTSNDYMGSVILPLTEIDPRAGPVWYTVMGDKVTDVSELISKKRGCRLSEINPINRVHRLKRLRDKVSNKVEKVVDKVVDVMDVDMKGELQLEFAYSFSSATKVSKKCKVEKAGPYHAVFDGTIGSYITGESLDLRDKSFSFEFWCRRDRKVSGYILGLGGISDKIDCGPDSSSSSSSTSGFFSKLKTFGKDVGDTISSIGCDVAKSSALHIGFRHSGKFCIGFYHDDLKTTERYNDYDEWHHWAGSYDVNSNHRVIYRDGQKVAEDHADRSFHGYGPLLVGKGPLDSLQAFQGAIAEVRIWGGVISLDHIRRLMEKILVRKEYSDMIASYQFTANSSQTNMDINGTVNFEITSAPLRHDSEDLRSGSIVSLQSNDAMYFDGNSKISVPACDTFNFRRKSFSFEFWCKRSSLNSSQTCVILGMGSKGHVREVLHAGFRSNSHFTFGFYHDDLTTDHPYPVVDEWHHWVGTFDAKSRNRSIYRDGCLISSDRAAASFHGFGELVIGSGCLKSFEGFIGSLDEIRLWDHALTPKDIKERMNISITRSIDFPGLLALYQFNSFDGNTIRDRTSTQNHGLFVGGTPNYVTSTAPIRSNSDAVTILDSLGKVPVVQKDAILIYQDLHLHICSEEVQPYLNTRSSWPGVLSKQAKFLLMQFALRNSLSDDMMAIAEWMNLSKIDHDVGVMRSSMLSALRRTPEFVSKNIESSACAALEASYRKEHELLLSMLAKYRDVFPAANHRSVANMGDVVALLGLLQNRISSNAGNLNEFVTSSFMEGVKDFYERTTAFHEVSLLKSTSQEEVVSLVKVVQDVSVEIGHLFSCYRDPFVSLDVDVAVLGCQYLIDRLDNDVRDFIDERKRSIDEQSAIIFELFFALRKLYQKHVQYAEAYLLPLENYHTLFKPFLNHWLRQSKSKIHEWVLQAMKLDKLVALDGVMYTSSVVDMFCIFHQSYSFLQKLQWPDIIENALWHTQLTMLISDGVLLYANATFANLKTNNLFEAKDQYSISEKLCLSLNNIEQVRKELDTIRDKMDIESMAHALGHSNDISRSPIAALFKDMYDVLDNGLTVIVSQVGHVQMSPEINNFLRQVAGLPTTEEDKNTSWFRDTLSLLDSSMLSDDATLATTEEVHREIQPLLDYLNGNLETLSIHLYEPVFHKTLFEIWIVTLENIRSMILPKKKTKFFLDNHRALTPRQSSFLIMAVSTLESFFFAGGDGLTKEEMASIDVQNHLKCVIDAFRKPTEELISQYYHLIAEHSSYCTALRDLGTVTLSAQRVDNAVTISLEHAVNLIPADIGKHSDPYVRTWLTPFTGGHPKAIKSKTINKSLSPKWNETLTLKYSSGSDNIQTLVITVWDHDLLSNDDFLGERVLLIDALPSASTKFELLDPAVDYPTEVYLLCAVLGRRKSTDKVAAAFLKYLRECSVVTSC